MVYFDNAKCLWKVNWFEDENFWFDFVILFVDCCICSLCFLSRLEYPNQGADGYGELAEATGDGVLFTAYCQNRSTLSYQDLNIFNL